MKGEREKEKERDGEIDMVQIQNGDWSMRKEQDYSQYVTRFKEMTIKTVSLLLVTIRNINQFLQSIFNNPCAHSSFKKNSV